MGLAEPKKRIKIGKDPNNTAWSRNESTFGQRILRSHGWAPGQHLGSGSYSEIPPSISHITVTLRPENLGLGARHTRPVDECTGLGDFQDLLGRLNGKDEAEIERERKVREDVKIGRYLGERMGGAIRFVRGGWLVGDLERDEKPDVDVAGANEEASVEGNKSDGSRRGDQKPKKEKKRKASSSSEKAGDGDNERKRKKKLRKTHTDDANKTTREEEGALATSEEVSELADSTDIEPRKRKKSKEDSQRTRDAGEAGGERAEEAKKKRKSKNAGEGEKAKKNRKSRDADETVEGEITDKKTKKKRRRKDEEGETEGLPSERVGHQTTFVSVKHVEITTSTGSASGSGTSTPLHTRHLVRSRNIASKRMALMDSEALNQIFMIKSQS